MGPLGILGGGQLGRMTLQAASALGMDVVIAERFADSPAARLTSRSIVFTSGWDDAEALDRLARLAPVVTLESEFVDAGVLDALERRGARVLPAPACVRVVQDKLLQKQALASAELPVPRFAHVDHPADLRPAGAELGWPVMLKARRDGYDGRGNVVVRDPAEATAAFTRLGWPERSLFVEAFAQFDHELAVLVVRGIDGQIVQYPVVETWQDATLHICREVLAPADVPLDVAQRAVAIARGAVEAVDGIGAFGVELFWLRNGEVCINELAPRPHNSAHYTIEACWTSQFDNHVRAVMGLPLGDPGLRTPAAAMVNLLGTATGRVGGEDLRLALAVPQTYVHLYGKSENRPGRKMGHVTALGLSADEALTRARAAASQIPV
ncbi:MAG TPA: 5-(carboxyamino)imidazole ribonucleotide synthase [Chloroflexota bacterium]|nr:5-(carboxyamino)imidazole ribonucleotide synthase [Chloroflexota bacterium]